MFSQSDYHFFSTPLDYHFSSSNLRTITNAPYHIQEEDFLEEFKIKRCELQTNKCDSHPKHKLWKKSQFQMFEMEMK